MPTALVIRRSSLGDIVLIQPVLEALSQAGYTVDLWVDPQYCRLAGLLPGAARVISSLEALARTYALALDLHGTGKSRWAVHAARCRRILTYSKHALARRLLVRLQGRPWPWNRWSSLHGRQSVTEWYARPVRRLGMGMKSLLPRLEISQVTQQAVDVILKQHGLGGQKLAVFAPGAKWPTKQWPAENFSWLAGRLAQEFGLFPIFIGGRGEAALCRQIAQTAGRAVSLAGETELDVMAALLQRAEIAIVNDSGPLHVAVAVNTRVLAFFGPTVAEFGFMPRPEYTRARVLEQNLPCRPCSLHGSPCCPLGHHDCLRRTTMEEAFAAAEELLARP